MSLGVTPAGAERIVVPPIHPLAAYTMKNQQFQTSPHFPRPFLPLDPHVIPDGWPSPGLRETLQSCGPFFSGKRVLVTGAFGFVGGHLVRALHALGARITALDCDVTPDRPALLNITGLRDQVTVVEADITDFPAMREVVKDGRFEIIFHLAAGATTIEKAMSDPYATILANTMGFVNVAEAARLLPAHEHPLVIYSSTDKVYGESTELPYSEDTTRLNGIGVYDSAKLAADIFSATYHRALGVPTIVLRMCNLYGAFDFNFNYRLVPKATRNIFRDGQAPDLYYNSLDHYRDYLYVEDAVRAFLLLARHDACRGRVYNLPGTLHAATPYVLHEVVDLVAAMQQEAQRVSPEAPLATLEWDPSIRVVKSDSSLLVIARQHLDGSRIKDEAEFEPRTLFLDGLLHTVAFYYWYFLLYQGRRQAQPVVNASVELPATNGHAHAGAVKA